MALYSLNKFLYVYGGINSIVIRLRDYMNWMLTFMTTLPLVPNLEQDSLDLAHLTTTHKDLKVPPYHIPEVLDHKAPPWIIQVALVHRVHRVHILVHLGLKVHRPITQEV